MKKTFHENILYWDATTISAILIIFLLMTESNFIK